MLKRRLTLFTLFALLFGLMVGSALAQTSPDRLTIGEINTEDFPELSFTLAAFDAENNFVADLSDLILSEDGKAITAFDVESYDTGTEVVFVIDANSTIQSRDEAGGLTRREKVRDSIISYANRYVDPNQADRVTIIVPESDDGRFLDASGMSFPNEVINAVNFYEPDQFGETNLNRMMNLALNQAESNRDAGRYQAIVLFTDAGQLADQLDYASLLERAGEAGVAIYGGILGAQASTSEVNNITRLSEPTGGLYVHMPNPDDAATLYDAIRQRSGKHRLTYRSAINSAGDHTVVAQAGTAMTEISFKLDVQPPSVLMAVDNSQPIRRVAPAFDTPLEEMEPRVQPLVVEVKWPDGYPRLLDAASLMVDGVVKPLENSVLDNSGILTFDWDVSTLDEGTYVLQVQVTDELGLRGTSDLLPLNIEVDRPTLPVTETPVPLPTDVIVEEAPDEETSLFGLSARAIAILGGAALLLVFAVFSIIIVFFLRGRSPEPVASPTPPVYAPGQAAPPVYPPPQPPSYPLPLGDEVTQIIPPDFALDEFAGAYLEPLENASDHSALIPLAGSNVSLGRDPKRVDVTFRDRSVSRLHARIVESHGTYRIYDEGSASGTYVNYERISLSPRALSDKDDIHFGRVHLRFHLASSLQQDMTTNIMGPGDDTPETQIY